MLVMNLPWFILVNYFVNNVTFAYFADRFLKERRYQHSFWLFVILNFGVNIFILFFFIDYLWLKQLLGFSGFIISCWICYKDTCMKYICCLLITFSLCAIIEITAHLFCLMFFHINVLEPMTNLQYVLFYISTNTYFMLLITLFLKLRKMLSFVHRYYIVYGALCASVSMIVLLFIYFFYIREQTLCLVLWGVVFALTILLDIIIFHKMKSLQMDEQFEQKSIYLRDIYAQTLKSYEVDKQQEELMHTLRHDLINYIAFMEGSSNEE